MRVGGGRDPLEYGAAGTGRRNVEIKWVRGAGEGVPKRTKWSQGRAIGGGRIV